ncbi:polyphosphate kinase 1 [Coraliomargarita akajimensis]|uniref:Polyphosphate kinase n=1 Tax=Coraliomargarita akajimensis (strain DSM 45221 / IAM 15411 / JCM 23193 / KCTC 12865 / 04OKA010-24) TaxID=583355 RepID=D5EQ60_CORAD|nr:polyphosphate kinase 1 [Coraliomargarita akajimensis]ADE53828.1 Polyphosphate kinase [Coraliomargarita akajimensis DSM 45221]
MSKQPVARFPYFNRELSWLAFNRRVLEQAESDMYPLLERMKFLAFVSSNLDEFFEIRFSGLMQQVKSGNIERGPDGLGPKELIRRIQSIAKRLVSDQYDCWRTQIVPNLAEEGIKYCAYSDLTRNEKAWVKEYFEEQVFPVLTPLAIDPAHPFPKLTNKALYILTSIDDPETRIIERLMAIIPVPRILPRIVKIGVPRRGNPEVYISLSDIIQRHVKALFPGYKVRSAVPFRITRNSDLYIDEEEIENLLNQVEEELMNREKGAAVRLEIASGADPVLLNELLDAIDLTPENVYTIDGPLNMARLMSAYDLIDRPDLKFEAQVPYTHPELENPEKLFEQITQKDYLLHQPYDSFQPFVDFIQRAARDPKVFAIKQTLYRTSGDSPVVEALMEASRNGKQVTVLVEIKARFDEANNIQWARQLEDVGVHVVYGLVGLKTHCKTCMVVRRENGKLKRYVHLGTGNYNPKTAKLYTDLSFFTAREEITSEVASLFNTLTGFSLTPVFKKLLVAPFNLHSTIQKYIQVETRNAKAGKPARIIVQTNSLVDQETIDNLYLASQAGVKIDLIVRGICNLVPGIKDLSENIRVRSILGRFLEHSRIFYFENSSGTQAHILAGSADWMPRNFYRRIECVFPIEDAAIRQRVLELLEVYLTDTKHARFLRSTGAYSKASRKSKSSLISAQETFIAESLERRAKLVKKEPAHSENELIPLQKPGTQDEPA